MISSGYFKVPEDIINWDKEKAKQFLWEMLNYGGRISHHEYKYWMRKLAKKQRPTVFQFKNGKWVNIKQDGKPRFFINGKWQ